MNFDLILGGLFVVTTVTTATVQAIKQLKTNFSNNLMALIVSLILSIALGTIYAIFNEIDVNIQYGANVLILAFMSALASQLGYDKIKQMLLQLKEGKNE